MKILTTFLLAVLAIGASAAPQVAQQSSRTNAILPFVHFDAAESVFRVFLSADRQSPGFTNTSYGPHDPLALAA